MVIAYLLGLLNHITNLEIHPVTDFQRICCFKYDDQPATIIQMIFDPMFTEIKPNLQEIIEVHKNKIMLVSADKICYTANCKIDKKLK